MKLKEFFQGGAEVKSARKKRETLDKISVKKGSLNNKQQEAYSETSRLIRNHRLKVALTLGGSSLIAAGGLYLLIDALPLEDDIVKNPKPRKEVTYNKMSESEILNGPNSDYFLIENNIERTDILIQKVENALLEFEKRIVSKWDYAPNYMKQRLAEPFEMLKINTVDNPDRNYYRNFKATDELHVAHSFIFNFRILSDDLKLSLADRNIYFAGAFERLSRSLFVNEDFETKNPLELISIYHELVHALSDGFLRMRLDKDARSKYEEFLGGKGANISIVGEEAKAIAYEIDILNILLDNKLGRSVDFGEDLNSQELLEDLALENKPFNLMKIETNLPLIKAYYPHGMGPRGELSEKYIDAVRNMLKKKGGIIYETMPF